MFREDFLEEVAFRLTSQVTWIQIPFCHLLVNISWANHLTLLGFCFHNENTGFLIFPTYSNISHLYLLGLNEIMFIVPGS